MIVLVDDEDYEWLNQWKWKEHKSGNVYYARRSGGRDATIIMHRLLTNCPKGVDVDHIDGNGLNNQKSNLRIVTKRQNQQNQHIKNTSQYPGVTWNKTVKRWYAQTKVNGKNIYLGCFINEIDAFRAYYDFILSIGGEILDFPYPLNSN